LQTAALFLFGYVNPHSISVDRYRIEGDTATRHIWIFGFNPYYDFAALPIAASTAVSQTRKLTSLLLSLLLLLDLKPLGIWIPLL
jgi:hypothetical protein